LRDGVGSPHGGSCGTTRTGVDGHLGLVHCAVCAYRLLWWRARRHLTLLSSLSAEVRCLTRSVVWLCWQSVGGVAKVALHEGDMPWWHRQLVVVAFGHVCLVVVSTGGGLMVVWWSCPPHSHLIVGGGALIGRGECRWQIGVGGAAGRWLTMVGVGSGWSWNVKRRRRWWLFQHHLFTSGMDGSRRRVHRLHV
jgi:hypothetical protein